MLDIEALAWPASRLGEAIEFLAQKAGLATHPAAIPLHALDDREIDRQDLARWMAMVTGHLGLEAEAVTSSYTELERMVRRAGPALLRLPGGKQPGFLALLKGGPWRVSVVTPNLAVRRLRPASICAALTHELEAPWLQPIEALLMTAAVPEHRRPRARRAILDEQLGSVQISGCWLLRLSPGTDFWKQVRCARLPRYGLTLVVAHAIQQGLQIVGWWIIVQGAIQGHFDRAWLWAWCLVLFTSIPFRLLGLWMQSLLTVGLGALFKQRLLFGALQLEPEEIRHQGTGQFLGRVMESQTIETLILGGGFAAVTAVIELVMATVILAQGAGGWVHALLLLLWTGLTLLSGWHYLVRNRDWRHSHRHMIQALVERMVGYRTRLAQQSPADWHVQEDQSLTGYLRLGQQLDGIEVRLSALIGRGWLIIGLAGIGYPVITGSATAIPLAISLGGIMLAYKALGSLVEGVQSVVGVINMREQVAPLFDAATRAQQIHPPAFTASSTVVDRTAAAEPSSSQTAASDEQLLARELVFRYRDYGEPVLQRCSLRIEQGERLLLAGPSGGGKSTLAAMLTGLRTPGSGLLLLQGMDQHTLGVETWRRRVVAAPQFHENHILVETFAFNLLMGRGWPPSPQDLEEAEVLCRELGLGELLERMPAGLQQMIGESGWQLSHGERSRLYIARALLQQADLIVLDESFGALDPENLQRVLRCVLTRAPTLLVIAHP